MKNLEDFKLTNEMLSKILGGSDSLESYNFTGIDAPLQAARVAIMRATCFCSCSCADGPGAGSGGGTGAAYSSIAAISRVALVSAK